MCETLRYSRDSEHSWCYITAGFLDCSPVATKGHPLSFPDFDHCIVLGEIIFPCFRKHRHALLNDRNQLILGNAAQQG